MIQIRFYDPSECTNMDPEDSEGDDDRDFYVHIGDCNFKIDKILSNLLIEERYDALKNIIMQDEANAIEGGNEESLESEEFLT